MCTGVPSLRFSVHEYLFLFFSPFARVTTVIRYTNRVIILSTVVKYIMAPPPQYLYRVHREGRASGSMLRVSKRRKNNSYAFFALSLGLGMSCVFVSVSPNPRNHPNEHYAFLMCVCSSVSGMKPLQEGGGHRSRYIPLELGWNRRTRTLGCTPATHWVGRHK